MLRKALGTDIRPMRHETVSGIEMHFVSNQQVESGLQGTRTPEMSLGTRSSTLEEGGPSKP